MNNQVIQTVVQDTGNSNKLSTKELFFKYLVYLPLFILSIGIAITVAYLYIRYSVSQYSSSVSMLINSERGGQRSSGTLSFEDIVTGKRTVNLANEIEIIRSTSTMTRVVKSLGLNLEYYGQGKVRKSELYKSSPVTAKILLIKDSTGSIEFAVTKEKEQVFIEYNDKKHVLKNEAIISTNIGNFQMSYNVDDFVPEYTYYIRWQPVKPSAAALASSLQVSQLNKQASILRISIITQSPLKGRDVLNQLVKEYDEMNIEDKNKIIDNTLSFIDERMNLLAKELDRVEDDLQGFRQQHEAVDLKQQSEASFSEMTQLRGVLNDHEAQLQLIEMVREYISNPSRKFHLVPSSLGIEDATLNTLIGEYNRTQLEREQELQHMSENHPAIKLIENRIEKVRVSIIENLNNISRKIQQKRRSAEAEYNSTLVKLRSIPAKERELLEIMRQQGIKEKLFTFLLQRREENAISRASSVGNSEAIDEAVGGGRISPNTSNIYRMAFILGILAPLALIYVRDLLNDKIITRTDLLKATKAPIIGEVAHNIEMTRKFVVGVKDRSLLAEQFRIIRTNLQFLLANSSSQSQIILVTSSVAGEGKTFTSMNLAAVWAVAGKKTVIIELDLRKPKISSALGLPRDKGITNYVLGTVRKEELAQPLNNVPNLFIVCAGPIPPNPSEMIMDKKVEEMFTYLRSQFDIIIIDSAPIGLVSDSKILSRFADATMYVVRQRYTVKKQIAFVEDLYQQKILPNMGILVNDVKIGGANSYYGYGYGYGYGYSYNYNYSYSYGEQEKKGILKRLKDFIGL